MIYKDFQNLRLPMLGFGSMGRALSRYPRESWLLASKFPGYDVSNIRPDRVEAIFEE